MPVNQLISDKKNITMNLQDLLTLMQGGDMNRCQSLLETHCIVETLAESFSEYNPKDHKVTNKTARPDKMLKEEDGNVTGTVTVARLPLAIQKKIVLVSAAFLGTPKLQCTPEGDAQENLFAGINKTWDDNKLDYSFKSIAKKVMAQRHAAELWYTKEADADYWNGTNIDGKFKLSMKVLSACKGDTLYPVFDEYGDMVAFGRGYKIKDEEGKEINHFDVYTADQIYYSKNVNSSWLFADAARVYSEGFKSIPNVIKKIPVIYYWQPLTEWEDVQPLIERLETKISNHADTNDYYDSPIVKAKGDVKGFSGKGESGKVLEMSEGADAEYLTYDSLPESMRMEMENLQKFIYSLTSTPDVSFDNLKSLGYFSTVAMQTMFMDAHLKAADKEEIFGEGLQRRVNYIKAALSVIDGKLKPALPMPVKPVFKYFLPENHVEQVETLAKALGAGIISKETAIKLNPLVSDAKAEITEINTQGTSADENSTIAKTLKALNGLSPLVANKVLESLTEDEIRALVLLGKKPLVDTPPAPAQ